MPNLNLKKKEALYSNIEVDLLTDFYKRSSNKNNKNYRFAKLDANFISFLPYLKDGAVKLYLHYSLSANSEKGDSWHSINTISEKLDSTERSVSNWNNELEDMGLIYRTKNRKKSKSTFLLPLTSFASSMSVEKIHQIFTDLTLFDSSEQTRIFGKFHSLTKLYIKTEDDTIFHQVICVHLGRDTKFESKVISTTNIFLYYFEQVECIDINEQISIHEYADKVIIVNEKSELSLGIKNLSYENGDYPSYCINEVCQISDATIYDIMSQLVDDFDSSELPVIERNKKEEL